MTSKNDPVYSSNVVGFTAAAIEFCKYAENADRMKGEELLRILQRILPYLYVKASCCRRSNPGLMTVTRNS